MRNYKKRQEWEVNMITARGFQDERSNALAEARDAESLGMATEAEALRAHARELFRKYKAAKQAADQEFLA